MIGNIPAINATSPFAATQPSAPFASTSTDAGAGIEASFAALLSNSASGTVDTLKHAETMSVEALQGRAETREVVDAVMSAEQALQTAISIRDKIVTSYLEISRMAI